MPIPQADGASEHARFLVLFLGLALCGWTFSRLGKRSLLLSVSAILVAVGLGLIAFAAFPSLFDRVAYALGVKYPPMLYLIVLVLCLSGTLLHLASRISLLDTRCRRLTQEIALLEHRAAPAPNSGVSAQTTSALIALQNAGHQRATEEPVASAGSSL